MARYTKHKSNYVLRNFHQNTTKGKIFERDWVTIGETLAFGRGKTPYYNDGNFIFTTGNTADVNKRHRLGTTVATWTYEDVQDATTKVNEVKVSQNTDDIRTYAYYGSAQELIKTSLEQIIKWFPGEIRSGTHGLEYTSQDGSFVKIVNSKNVNMIQIDNPFDVNLYQQDVKITTDINELRYFQSSFDKYEISVNNEDYKEIERVEVIEDWKYNKNCIRQWNQLRDSSDSSKLFGSCVVQITITDKGGSTVVICGYMVYKQLIYMTDANTTFKLKPKDEVIEEYFNNLSDFESVLLNRDTSPLYKSTFLTPFEGEYGFKYVYRYYTFPTLGDYCIDITSARYTTYVNLLLSMAEIYDNMWVNNLYRCMVHESIKNFDWTYRKEGINDEEIEDNEEGGLRMEKILHVTGRVFDDIKRKIDGIKRMNTITYLGYDNMPDATISDSLETHGWDVFSTIPKFYDTENDKTVDFSTLPIAYSENKWYSSLNANNYTAADVDVSFMRRLLLNSKRIFSSKGTQESIKMILGMFGFSVGTSVDEEKPEYDFDLHEYNYNAVELKSVSSYDDKDVFSYETDSNDSVSYSINDLIEINTTYKDKIIMYSDDDFSGVPLSVKVKRNFPDKTTNETSDTAVVDNTKIEEKYYLRPYLSNDKIYDGDLVFQSDGGWGKYIDIDKDFSYDNPYTGYDYLETLTYLKVVSKVGDLLNVDFKTINDNDIFYVVNLSDWFNYNDQECFINVENGEKDNNGIETLKSHFFLLKNKYAYSDWSGWENLDEDGEYKDRIKYLDNLISTNIGNNPHIGYGMYDCGQMFIDYIKKPFKYSIDNFLIETGYQEVNSLNFTISDLKKDDKVSIEKQQLCVNTNNTDGKTDEENTNRELRDFTEEVINTKVVKLVNNVGKGNSLFIEYFQKVILNYLLQVIPSTTILMLQGFKL